MKTKRKSTKPPRPKTLGTRVKDLEIDLDIVNHNLAERLTKLEAGPKATDPVCCPFGARKTPALNAWVARDRNATNHGLPWSEEDRRDALRWHDANTPIPVIARDLRRTPFSVFCKILKEGNQFDAMKRNALTEDNVYQVMAQIAVAKGLVKWA